MLCVCVCVCVHVCYVYCRSFGVWSSLGGLGLASVVLFVAVRCQQWRLGRARAGKAKAAPEPDDDI